MCENLARYSLVTLKHKKAYIDSLKACEDPSTNPPASDNSNTVSIDRNATTGLNKLADRAYL